jgi:hypothetical protein
MNAEDFVPRRQWSDLGERTPGIRLPASEAESLLDGNRDGNDGNHRQPVAVVNSHVLSQNLTRAWQPLHLKNGRSQRPSRRDCLPLFGHPATLNTAAYCAQVSSISAGHHENRQVAGARDTVYGSDVGRPEACHIPQRAQQWSGTLLGRRSASRPLVVEDGHQHIVVPAPIV